MPGKVITPDQQEFYGGALLIPVVAADPVGAVTIEFHEIADARRKGFETRIATIDVVRCCHCNGVFWMTKYSLRKRGYCSGCNAVHCGAPPCWTCKPRNEQTAKRLGKM